MQASQFISDSPDADADGSNVQQHLRSGLQLFGDGKTKEAVAAFQRGLAEAERAGTESAETMSDLYARLGNMAASCGDFQTASINYQAALKIAPHLTNCWCDFGDLHLRLGQHQRSIELYLQALKLNPRHWAARFNMVQALMAAKQYLIAKAVLVELKTERPDDARICNLLGKTLFELNEVEPAITSFLEAVALNPQDAGSINWTGALKQSLGDQAGARAAYAQSARIQPLI